MFTIWNTLYSTSSWPKWRKTTKVNLTVKELGFKKKKKKNQYLCTKKIVSRIWWMCVHSRVCLCARTIKLCVSTIQLYVSTIKLWKLKVRHGSIISEVCRKMTNLLKKTFFSFLYNAHKLYKKIPIADQLPGRSSTSNGRIILWSVQLNRLSPIPHEGDIIRKLALWEIIK